MIAGWKGGIHSSAIATFGRMQKGSDMHFIYNIFNWLG
jgi:hypothetical protein